MRFKKDDIVRMRRGQRLLQVLTNPRRVDGGHVVEVTWLNNDGQTHEAQRPGFRWSEPTVNLILALGQ